jgi:glutamate-1-semialdehyde 2,1-aminomutase
MGAVVGRRDVMEAASRMFISSTYWSDTIGLRAALTTLREVRRRDVPKTVHEIGTRLQSEITAVARETGLPARCEGLSFHPHLAFDVEDAQQRSQLGTLFIQEMAKRGCHGYTSFYLNAAQTSRDIDQTVAAARETFQIMAAGVERGNLGQLLECQQQVESFRRLVR